MLRDGRLVGIFTDRDILRKVVEHPETWDQPIATVMTPNPRTLDEKATAAEALALMNQLHVRNVPVVRSNGEVVGNFTPYAIVRFLADTFPVTIYNRPPTPSVAGAASVRGLSWFLFVCFPLRGAPSAGRTELSTLLHPRSQRRLVTMTASHRPVLVKELDHVVIRFAGDSGDGMQLTGTQFTNTAAIVGNDISTCPIIRPKFGRRPGR